MITNCSQETDAAREVPVMKWSNSFCFRTFHLKISRMSKLGDLLTKESIKRLGLRFCGYSFSSNFDRFVFDLVASFRDQIANNCTNQ